MKIFALQQQQRDVWMMRQQPGSILRLLQIQAIRGVVRLDFEPLQRAGKGKPRIK